MTAFSSQQVLALLVGILSLGFLSPILILVAYIVLGHAHFLLAYYYKFKAGKINKKHLLPYLLLAVFVFSLPTFLSMESILLIIAILFGTHFFFDEARLLEGEVEKVSLSLSVPAIITFVGLVAYTETSYDFMLPAILVSVAIIVWSLASTGIRNLFLPHVLYLNLFTLLFSLIYIFGIEISGEAVFGSIILMHITTWYVFYYKKLKSAPKRLVQFIVDCVVINALFIILYFVFMSQGEGSIGQYVFSPIYYYCWAILHIVTSSGELFALVKERSLRLF
ncbi:hypothetical protein KC850_04060 [Candidatus Kaiserbacteria bacterium]|nr:hypothetical protein [Candidatus Kaiserbacteria bacterium]